MAKSPTTRGFTLAEKRALLFEQVSLYAVFLVALIAAAISFIALRAVGSDAGLGRASFLLPIAIDGFGIACSVGIVRSVASGEKFRDRASEWVGLFAALGLSILGNVHHALTVGAATLPDYVKFSYAAAIPLIVAYGIHVYGRAMSKGISAHVLADAPDELTFDLRHLGDTVSAQRAPIARPKPAQPAARAAQPAQPERAPEVAPARPPMAKETLVRAASGDDEKDRARAIFDRMVTADPINKPNAGEIHRQAEATCNKATSRRWVTDWWDEHQESLGMAPADPIGAQIVAEGPTESASRTA